MSGEKAEGEGTSESATVTAEAKAKKPRAKRASGATQSAGSRKGVGGRPTKLTPALRKQLVRMLEDGNPISASCASLGIDETTFRKWRARARSEDDPELAKFFVDIARARARGELKLYKRALRGDGAGRSNGPARCAQWALERQFGNKYAPRVNLKVEEELETFLDVAERVLPGEHYEALLEAIVELRNEPEPETLLGAQEPAVH